MKTIRFFAAVLMTATMLAGFSSCIINKNDEPEPEHGSGELWNGNYTAPEYENAAVAYNITDDDAPYTFIELTANGSYIVERNLDYYESGYSQFPNYAPKSIKKYVEKSVFVKKTASSRSNWDKIIYGNYSEQAPGQYSLEGFGIIIVNTDGTITVKNSEIGTLTMNVEIENPVEGTELNNRFCRSWYVLYGTIELRNSKGELLDSIDIKDPTDVQHMYVQYITVTKYSTFFQVDWDNLVEDTGIWRWKNTGKQIFQYKWDDGPTVNDAEWGILQIGFNGQKATFIESMPVELDVEDIEDYFGDLDFSGKGTIVFKTTCKGV